MKIKNTIYLLIVIIMVSSGCEKPMIGEPGNCKIGISYKVNWDLSFSIDSIHDYRCPIPFACIWGGDVDLYFNIKRPFKTTNTLINLNNQDRNPVNIGDYTIRVLKVNPYPEVNVEVDPEDFRITMQIMKD